MANTIRCSKCGEEIEVTEALTHQIEEQVIATTRSKVLKETEEKLALQFNDKLLKLEAEKVEEAERNKSLSKQLNELLEETRILRRKGEDMELTMKKKLLEEEEKIRQETKKRTEEEHQLKDLEKEKLITDLKKALFEAQKKAEQGSQQTQGESLELTLETKLKQEFPSDDISEVKKGVKGADIIQTVFNKNGVSCGTILWESKNAKWSDTWAGKLREDQRSAKADLAVLVTVNMPNGVETFSFINGVWVCSWKYFIPLAMTLRFNLVNIEHEKQKTVGVSEKMQDMYDYLTSNEFKHRVEGIVEAFGTLQDDIEREKRWFASKWARQEKEIRRVIDHTHGMYGDLQGVTGKALPEIKSLSLENS